MSSGWAISGTFDDLLQSIDCEHQYGEWEPSTAEGVRRRQCSLCKTTEYSFEPATMESVQLELTIVGAPPSG